MSTPDIRIVVKGVGEAERRLVALLRLRREAERKGRDLERALRELDRKLADLQRETRRA